jgi:hypothetical protein
MMRRRDSLTTLIDRRMRAAMINTRLTTAATYFWAYL